MAARHPYYGRAKASNLGGRFSTKLRIPSPKSGCALCRSAHRPSACSLAASSDDSAAADASAAPGEQAQTRQAAEILETVRSLPEAYRETLILRLVEGMTGREIAAKTGLSHGSVRVNLNRGMQQLREKLGQRRTSASPGQEHEQRKIG